MILKTPHVNAATGSVIVTAEMRTGSTTEIFSYHVPGVSRMHVSPYSKKIAMAGTGSYEFSGNLQEKISTCFYRLVFLLEIFLNCLYLHVISCSFWSQFWSYQVHPGRAFRRNADGIYTLDIRKRCQSYVRCRFL